MSRTTRRRAVRAVAPVAGLLAAGLLVWQGSYAAFSATTVNKTDAWSTGSLALTNNGGVGSSYSGSTTALFSATKLVPGSTDTKCITVDSTGTLGGTLELYRAAITDTPNVLFPASKLSTKLNVTVTAAPLAAGQSVDSTCLAGTGTVVFPSSGTTQVFTGTLFGMPTAYNTSPAAGTFVTVSAGNLQRVAYKIQYTVDPTTDNTYQGSSVSADLQWEIQ
jgi:hypothetical protein